MCVENSKVRVSEDEVVEWFQSFFVFLTNIICILYKATLFYSYIFLVPTLAFREGLT